jgi:two-component system response regulator AtoC
VGASPHDRGTTTDAAASLVGEAVRGRYVLVVGEDHMAVKPLFPGELVIGRDEACDLALSNARISRRHARLIVGDEVRIEDIGSTNGIKVCGVRLERGVPAPLPLGESVRLGPYILMIIARSAGAAVSDDGLPRPSLVVHDPTLEGKTELIERVARHGVNVLIQGETGSGKDVLARTLHTLSGRTGELVAINCATLTAGLLESELFGHEQGAFTGATRSKPGLLELAAGGTVLLDEVADLPLALQGKLLRALEAGQVYRVGGVEPIQLRARVIAATHRVLLDEVALGTFRQDLYFRLNGITFEVLPLRRRRPSIAVLARRFLDEAARAVGVPTPRMTPAAQAALATHDWPGNVRELRLVIERALLLAGNGAIDAAHVLLSPGRVPVADDPGADERARFVAVARAFRGNTAAMGRALQTSPSQVRRLARRFEIDLDALRKEPETSQEP